MGEMIRGFGPGPMPDEAAPGIAGRVAYDLAASLWQASGWGCFWSGVAVGFLGMLALLVLSLVVAAILLAKGKS